MTTKVAVIAGVGYRLGASLARVFSREGFKLVLAARNVTKLDALATETGAEVISTDVSDPASVENLFHAVDGIGPLSLAIFNAAGRVRGGIADLNPEEVRKALLVGAYGGFLFGQQAARRLQAGGAGSILFTGATASVKGFANSAGFAMPKFGLRGLVDGPRTRAEEHPRGAFHHRWRHRLQRSDEVSGFDPARPLAFAGRDRRNLSRDPPAASKRLDMGDRIAAVDGEFLKLRRPDWTDFDKKIVSSVSAL